MELDPRATAAGARLIVLASVGSTNTEAMTLARAGDPGPVWIVAREQTAGRGRRGRAWRSPPGNLYASLLLLGACAPERAAQLSFVAALAAHDAFRAVAPSLGPSITLKWPNDVLLAGAKLAGILVEGETLASGRFASVIGIGVNCASHPDDTPYRATSLAREGCAAEPDDVFRALSAAMQSRLAQWDAGRDFAAIRSAWLERAARVGEPIVLRSPRVLEGTFAGVDDTGRLLLRAADGTVEAFTAAEIHLPSQKTGEDNAQ